jgi:hypothetical protein
MRSGRDLRRGDDQWAVSIGTVHASIKRFASQREETTIGMTADRCMRRLFNVSLRLSMGNTVLPPGRKVE